MANRVMPHLLAFNLLHLALAGAGILAVGADAGQSSHQLPSAAGADADELLESATP